MANKKTAKKKRLKDEKKRKLLGKSYIPDQEDLEEFFKDK